MDFVSSKGDAGSDSHEKVIVCFGPDMTAFTDREGMLDVISDMCGTNASLPQGFPPADEIFTFDPQGVDISEPPVVSCDPPFGNEFDPSDWTDGISRRCWDPPFSDYVEPPFVIPQIQSKPRSDVFDTFSYGSAGGGIAERWNWSDTEN